MEEHINATESHYVEDCPGVTLCPAERGLVRILDGVRRGTLVLTETTGR